VFRSGNSFATHDDLPQVLRKVKDCQPRGNFN